MKISAKNLGTLLEKEISKAPAQLKADMVRAFAQIIVDQGKTSKIDDLVRAFRIAWNKHHNEIDVTATVVNEKDAKVPHSIAGKKVNLRIIEDKKILGGIKIETDDFFVDNTVLTKIRSVKNIAK